MKKIIISALALLACSPVMAAEQNAKPNPKPNLPTPLHGYVANPPSRAVLCSSRVVAPLNTGCGSVQYEPQSVEGPKGFPTGGPIDGQIASAGNVAAPHDFSPLDAQTATRWYHVPMSSGPIVFHWTLTMPHRTSAWQFFITKQGWNPAMPLARASFDLTPFCERIEVGNPVPTPEVDVSCTIPQRTGYQVILAVWTIADTSNAFYQVIDANFGS